MADEGFFSRWSKRKQDIKAGKAVEVEPQGAGEPRADAPPLPPSTGPASGSSDDVLSPPAAQATGEAVPVAPPPPPPPPTLEDVDSLTFDSDFKRFVKPDVAPEVKTAAVKKLFADPRYNVRDMMDVYADDYSKPDPMPESMIRKLASAQFLRLFEEKTDEAEVVAQGPREVADDVSMQTVAQSQPIPQAVPEPTHDDPDLRLQQDDAASGEEPCDFVEPGAAASLEPVPARGGIVPEGGQG